MLSQHVSILNTLMISIDFSIAIDQNESVCQDNHLYHIFYHICQAYLRDVYHGYTARPDCHLGLLPRSYHHQST